MGWVNLPGVEGLVYVADHQPASERKHNCPDCQVCQMCSDSRCSRCLKRKACLKRKKKGR